jgi:hypothetical protein
LGVERNKHFKGLIFFKQSYFKRNTKQLHIKALKNTHFPSIFNRKVLLNCYKKPSKKYLQNKIKITALLYENSKSETILRSSYIQTFKKVHKIVKKIIQQSSKCQQYFINKYKQAITKQASKLISANRIYFNVSKVYADKQRQSFKIYDNRDMSAVEVRVQM